MTLFQYDCPKCNEPAGNSHRCGEPEGQYRHSTKRNTMNDDVTYYRNRLLAVQKDATKRLLAFTLGLNMEELRETAAKLVQIASRLDIAQAEYSTALTLAKVTP